MYYKEYKEQELKMNVEKIRKVIRRREGEEEKIVKIEVLESEIVKTPPVTMKIEIPERYLEAFNSLKSSHKKKSVLRLFRKQQLEYSPDRENAIKNLLKLSRKHLRKTKIKQLSGKIRALKQGREGGFYESREWQELRYKVLIHWGRKCMCCGTTEGEMHVDHIKPRSKYPELELDFNNLQVLCRACNMGKSNTDETDFRPKVANIPIT